VTFTDCKDASSYEFQPTLASCSTEPATFSAGSTVKVSIPGTTAHKSSINNLNVNVYWAGALLKTDNFQESIETTAGQELTVTFSLDVSVYSPNGDYVIEGFLQGDDQATGENGNLGCLHGEFTL